MLNHRSRALLFGSSVALVAAMSAGTALCQAQENADKPAKRTMRVQVLDLDGNPLKGVNIHASVWTKEPFKANRDYTTDAEGKTTVELPQKIDILRLWATKESHVGLFAQWWPEMQPDGHLIPDEYTFRLARGTTVGGVVKNEAGEPIRGSKVQVRLVTPPGAESRERPYPATWLSSGDNAKTTNADGRWSIDNVPAGDDVKVLVMLSHPEYMSETKWGSLQNEQMVTMRSLRDESATIVMHWGVSVSGIVRDGDGKPVKDAVVVWGDDPYFEEGSQEVRTDAEGHYRLPPRAFGPLTVTVIAPGWSPDQQKLDLSPANTAADFDLKPGKHLRIRFVNGAGEPVSKVAVGITAWRGGKALYNHQHPNVLDTKIPTRTNANGVFEWKWAPDDMVQYAFSAEGYEYIHQHPVIAGDEPAVVVLRK
jgi:Carboxypeptidase regulatory-like domain